MKRVLISATLAVLACVVASPPAMAQATTQTLIDSHGGVSQVVAMPAFTLHDVLGHKGLDLQAWGYTGFDMKAIASKPLNFGGAFTVRKRISAEAFADVGAFAEVKSGQQPEFGFCFSVGWYLGHAPAPSTEAHVIVVSAPGKTGTQ